MVADFAWNTKRRKTLNTPENIVEINNFLHKLADNDCNVDVINQINANAILYSQQCTKQFPNIAVIKAKQYLEANNLVEVLFDKGLGFCLLYKTTYVSKVQQLTSGDQFESLDVTKPHKMLKKYLLQKKRKSMLNCLI